MQSPPAEDWAQVNAQLSDGSISIACTCQCAQRIGNDCKDAWSNPALTRELAAFASLLTNAERRTYLCMCLFFQGCMVQMSLPESCRRSGAIKWMTSVCLVAHMYALDVCDRVP